MSFPETLALAVALAMDAGAVSLCAGAAGSVRTVRSALRLAFHFGLFQAGMPVLGGLLGRGLTAWLANLDHWVAFGLLLLVGARMIRSGWRGAAECAAPDPSRGTTLILLSVATSIDALAVGLGLGLLPVSLGTICLTIGVVTLLLSLGAVALGRRIGAALGRRMEIAGGAILILIGLRIVISHLAG